MIQKNNMALNTLFDHLKKPSFLGDSILNISFQDILIILGFAHQIKRKINIASKTTIKGVLDLSDVPTGNSIILLPLNFNATGGPVTIETYRITSYTEGTVVPSVNLNIENPQSTNAVVKMEITSTDEPGDDLREYGLGATGNPQQVNRSGSASGAMPLILVPNLKIVMEIYNDYTEAVDFYYDIIWYEI